MGMSELLRRWSRRLLSLTVTSHSTVQNFQCASFRLFGDSRSSYDYSDASKFGFLRNRNISRDLSLCGIRATVPCTMNKPPPSLLLTRNSCTGTVVSVAWARGIGLSVEWEPDLRAPGLLEVGSGFTEP